MKKRKKSKKNIFRNKIALIVLGLFLLLVFGYGGFLLGKLTEGKVSLRTNPKMYEETELTDLFNSSLIKQIWSILQIDYVDGESIEEKDLYYGALKGFVDGVGDSYTTFFDPELADEFDMQINGEFEGIGAEIAIKEKIVTIIAPLPGSPAEKAGLKAGDGIFAVNGQEIVGMSIEKAARLIRGPRNTEVTLTIISGEDLPRDVVVTRQLIELESVSWNRIENNILHIELASFSIDTDEQFDAIIKEVKQNKPTGIILDMRNNPGGVLDTVINIATLWIEKKNILIEKFGDGSEQKYKASGYTPFMDIPTVVLINQGSASGSEIMAGAFQDYEIATIVGKQSFGKGSVQTVRKLADGSALKVTIAKWLTPKGQSINEEGIVPDVEVEYTNEDFEQEKDPQLEKAIELLLN